MLSVNFKESCEWLLFNRPRFMSQGYFCQADEFQALLKSDIFTDVFAEVLFVKRLEHGNVFI
jgi:hypothetical protein